jgi:TonB-linked SusC/RagA family outer membrane protein
MSSTSIRRRWSTAGLALLVSLAAVGAAHAQPATINGRVTSDQGAALELANVFIQEMNISVVTDSTGRYSINIPQERVRGQAATLRVRRIGFVVSSIPVTINPGTQSHDFTLKMDVNRLSDVIVTGVTAGTEQRKLPYAATVLSTADMPVPQTNALTQLQGKVTGAQIVMPSGRPGQTPSIVLRGPKSLNADNRSQGPLVIMDGVLLAGGTQDINPLDIENIEVVKGAAGSSMYGSRAGAGVIQITTKSARNSPAGVRFAIRNEYGFSDIQGAYPFSHNHPMMMDETMSKFCIAVSGQPACSRVVDFEAEALRVNEQGGDFALTPYVFERDFGIGKAPSKPELQGLFLVNRWPRQYDPIEQTVTPGQYNQANVDMTGRLGNTGFFVSGGFTREEGAIKFLDGDTRASARVNVDQKIGDDWDVQLQTFYSRRNNYPIIDFFRLTRVPAGVNLLRRDVRGRLFIRSNPLNQGGQNQNPLYAGEQSYGVTKSDRFIGSITTRYTPFDWLDFEGSAAVDRDRDNGLTMNDKGFRTTSVNPGTNNGTMTGTSSSGLSYNLMMSGTARRDFGTDLASRFNVRYVYEQQDSENLSSTGNTLAVQGLRDLGNVTANQAVNSGESTVRAIGLSSGLNLEYKERYIADVSYRIDGSSLFGEDNRWAPYHRASMAWRISDEPFWPLVDAINDLKLRASLGTAGGRPSFAAQYETFSVGAGGAITAQNLGNKNLKPETTTETEFGIDAELYSRFGLNVTYARDITKDQIFEVPPSVSSGFSSQWQNAGTLDGKTWEVSVNVPIITSRDITWSSRVMWDRTRTHITELGVPTFFQSSNSSTFKYGVGEQIGTIYGKRFVTNCSELPGDFQSQCGPGREWQQNDEGFVVWVGAGNTPGDGITKNLWQAVRPGCIVGGVGRTDITGEVNCLAEGGTLNSPWGIPETYWGMLTVMRDSTASPRLLSLGNTLPDYRLTLSQSFQWKKLYIYGLIDRSVGNELMNEELHWSLGDFMVKEEDQAGKSVQSAKPLGYYWRAPRPDGTGAGVGGFYDVLGANNHTVEDGSYTKLRELSASYNIGQIPGVRAGDWTITVTGRNLYTWTKFKGWDPEVGVTGGNLNSSALNAVASYQYPPRRTFSFTVNSRF